MESSLNVKTEMGKAYLETIFSRFDMKGTLAVISELEKNPALTATMQLNLLPSLDGKKIITLLTIELKEDIFTPFNLKIREVNAENAISTLEAILSCRPLAQKMKAIEQCACPTDLDFTSMLLQAGFLEVVDYPEKFFYLLNTTPKQLGLKGDIASVNEMLIRSLSYDSWEPAITVSTKEILEYLHKVTI